MLPTELWDSIFKYLDYYELPKLKTVSKRWNAIVTEVIKSKYGWYDKCRKEVPEKYWSSILASKVHPVNQRIRCENFHEERNYSVIWKSLYSSWIEWSKIRDKIPSIEKAVFEPPYGNNGPADFIVSLAVEGNIIALVMADGYIRLFDVSRLSVDPIYKIDYRGGLEALQLGKKGSDVLAIVLSFQNNLNWNVESRELIYSQRMQSSENILGCTTFGYSCLARSYMFKRKVYCKAEIRKLASKEGPRFVRFRMHFNEELEDMQADGDIVMLLSVDSEENRVILYTISIRENKLKEVYNNSLNTTFTASYSIFQPCVAVCVDHHDTIGFSVSGRKWKLYDTKKDLKLETSISLWGVTYKVGLLILLLNSARMQIIYVDDADCLDSKLEAMPSRIIELAWDLDSVPDMKLTEYNSKKYLVVITYKELFVVKFL